MYFNIHIRLKIIWTDIGHHWIRVAFIELYEFEFCLIATNCASTTQHEYAF